MTAHAIQPATTPHQPATPATTATCAAPIPANEAQRLQVLLDLNLLDTPPDARFDRITRLAARLFGVPTALVSLIDAERQWFKSRVGLEFRETPRSASFCAHAILQDEVMVVRDACEDERFAHTPLVQGDNPVRFYAGSPIAAGDGHRIGTLCILDRVPREFSEEERGLLRDLAGIVGNEVAAIELKIASERQRRSEHAVRALLDHLPDGVLLVDDSGAIVSCNEAAERLFGVPCTTLARQPAASLVGFEPAPVARREGSGRRADGSLFAAEITIAAMPLDGRTHLALTVRDVAPYRAEQERVRAANERRHNYFRTASHELRTPMASILGFSELLLKRDFDAATGRELMDIIHRQATRLISLVNQMLDLARIDSGGAAQLHPAALDLREVLAKMQGALEDPAQAARLDLRPGNDVLRVFADPLRIQQALHNIVSNALAYSAPESRVEVALAPEARDGRAGVLATVRDQGIGMTPEQREQVYDAFWRAGALPDVAGNGLGMTIVREIVDLHGGVVEIDSTPGGGSQVALCLPAAEGGAAR